MNRQRIGVIADTHGLLRPEAIAALEGSSLIIHAGDLGKQAVLEGLQRIAPVVAVRGNVDTEPWCRSLPLFETVTVSSSRFHIIHNLSDLDVDPGTAGVDAVIFGHSHQPSMRTRGGVLFLNPGSAGPRRFRLPVSVAIIDVKGGVLEPQLVNLAIPD